MEAIITIAGFFLMGFAILATGAALIFIRGPHNNNGCSQP
jgi:hypothetical protein